MLSSCWPIRMYSLGLYPDILISEIWVTSSSEIWKYFSLNFTVQNLWTGSKEVVELGPADSLIQVLTQARISSVNELDELGRAGSTTIVHVQMSSAGEAVLPKLV